MQTYMQRGFKSILFSKNTRRAPKQNVLDHSDPSKPSHRLTNGPEPSKTIESDGKINLQSLEDTQVGYISQKCTLDKNTSEKCILKNTLPPELRNLALNLCNLAHNLRNIAHNLRNLVHNLRNPKCSKCIEILKVHPNSESASKF